jgi:hypothetical protein
MAGGDMDIIERLRRSATIALIVSPTGLLFIAVVRLLLISNYSPITAMGIVASDGYVNTLLGTVIPLIPILLPYIALVLLFSRRVILGVLALAASVMISPAMTSGPVVMKLTEKDGHLVLRWVRTHWDVVIFVAAVLVVLLLILGFNAFARTLGVVASVALLPLVIHLYPLPNNNSFYAEQLREPWLPAEIITLTSRQVVIGYGLSNNDSWLEILKEDSRRIVYYPSGEVLKQRVCQVGESQEMRPIITFNTTPPVVPQCKIPGFAVPKPYLFIDSPATAWPFYRL